MTNRYSKYHNVILKREGGFVDDPSDSGGLTYRGISQVSWPRWAGWKILKRYMPLSTNEVVKDAALDKLIEDFYYRNFWVPCKADSFKDNRVCLHVFDFSVNAGITRAAKILQRVVGAKGDGIIGPATIEKVNDTSLAASKYVHARRDYYTSIGVGKNAKFLSGWLKRVDLVDKEV
jgi:lysozyme family protein